MIKSLLRPDTGKLLYMAIGAALVAYTGFRKFMPKAG